MLTTEQKSAIESPSKPIAKIWVVVLIIGFLAGLFVDKFDRMETTGIFYTVCFGATCEVRAHTLRVGKDPIIWVGPLFPKQLGPNVVQMSGPQLADALNTLPGYGPHYRPPAGGK